MEGGSGVGAASERQHLTTPHRMVAGFAASFVFSASASVAPPDADGEAQLPEPKAATDEVRVVALREGAAGAHARSRCSCKPLLLLAQQQAIELYV